MCVPEKKLIKNLKELCTYMGYVADLAQIKEKQLKEGIEPSII